MIFLIHVGTSLMMTGLIWFVQIVHYPLFTEIPQADFSAYERQHTRRTGWLVAPLMLVELISGLLLFVLGQHTLPSSILIIEMALLGLIWASTFAIQMPLHMALSQQVDERKQRKLVHTNWFRTLGWSIRATLLLSCM